MLTTFEQVCKSHTSAVGSCKEWRGEYVKSDLISPVSQLAEWLAMVDQGQGALYEETMQASDISSVFPEECGEVYLLVLDDVPVKWNSLCDADIDTLFGGENLLDAAGNCKVTLMFQTETFQLTGIYLSAMEGETALEGALVIFPAEYSPAVDASSLDDCWKEAPLAEEWEILGR